MYHNSSSVGRSSTMANKKMVLLQNIAEGFVDSLGEMQIYGQQIIDARMLRYRH